MAIPLFTDQVENVSQLSDLPNAEDGLTAGQLKEVFDKAGVDIKSYINTKLIPALNLSLAKTFTVTFPAGETTYEFISSAYGLNADSVIWCQPEEDSASLWSSCGIKGSEVTENKLTFTAVTAPSSDVGINVIVFG